MYLPEELKRFGERDQEARFAEILRVRIHVSTIFSVGANVGDCARKSATEVFCDAQLPIRIGIETGV